MKMTSESNVWEIMLSIFCLFSGIHGVSLLQLNWEPRYVLFV
jgi:hypothetical protein